jgi:GDP-D-mannose dehydratase
MPRALVTGISGQDGYYLAWLLHVLVGDASRARERLGWSPTTTFAEVISAMVLHDLELLDNSLDHVG